MNIWQVLEISPTTDISAIKIAYATKLKQHHPEEDPEGYQLLREAYDTAIKQAKLQNKRSSEPESPQGADDVLPIIIDPLNSFIERARILYHDFPSRIDPARWAELLNADIMWDMKHKQMVEQRLHRFLLEHRLLPRSVWLLFESSFHWKGQDDPDYDEFLQFYLQQLDGPELRFSFIPPHMDIESIDRFLSLREAACHALQEHHLELAKQSIEDALDIFVEDPDLLRLQGEFLVRVGELDEALRVFNQVLLLRPTEADGYVYRARIYHERGLYSETIQECRKALTLDPENKEVQYLLGKSLKNVGEIGQAITVFKQMNAADPHDLGILSILTQLQRKDRGIHFTLSPAMKFRFQPGRRFLLFLLSALCFFTMFLSDQWIDPYRDPTVLVSPKELLKPNKNGAYVQVNLTKPYLTDYKELNGLIMDHTTASRLPNAGQHMNQVVLGYLDDTLVIAAVPLQSDEWLSGEGKFKGELKLFASNEVNAQFESKIKAKHDNKKVAPVIIDTSSSPPYSRLRTIENFFNFLMVIFYFWLIGAYIYKRL
ncbi:tetratricopeptide repeat protein [Gorillibacterium sp. sgz5001074]|uniref:tetratricopeptide repeat protein n=1 Tax=Gorillibacterium sp. sgz5001074 TaxID=3446695 RepID=UPI003F6701EF